MPENTKIDQFYDLCKEINGKAQHQQDLVQSSLSVCRSIPVGTHESAPHLTKTIIEVKVKEATKQGYSVARGGGVMRSTSHIQTANCGEEESG